MSSIKSVGPNPNSQYKQGFYSPQNIQKYGSKDKRIIYRSSLELKFCIYCDTDGSILNWVSEPQSMIVRYMHPFKRKMCSYNPDFYVKKMGSNGIATHYMIEVKPLDMLKTPKQPLPNATRKQILNYNRRLQTVIINRTKFMAARKFCEEKGMVYQFLTEKFFEGKN